MPRFDFQCNQCGHLFESTLLFGIKTLPECPRCHGPTQKCITPPCIHFKGQGFYKTDSTKSTTPSPAPADTKKTPTPETQTGKKESKTDKKETGGSNAKK